MTSTEHQEPTAGARLTLTVGASAELWRGDLKFGLGPRLGIGADWDRSLGLGLLGGFHWSPQKREGISAAEIEAAVTGWLRPAPLLWLNGALGASHLLVFTPLEHSADSDTLLVPTAWFGARAAFDVGEHTISAGPELRFHLAPRLVRANGKDVFTVPATTLGFVAELSLVP